MAKPWAVKFYKSAAWKRVRQAYFISKHGLCERCGAPGEIVHHKIYLNPNNINDPSISLNKNNLMLVCRDCHAEIHHRGKPVRKGFTFDEDGSLIQSPPLKK